MLKLVCKNRILLVGCGAVSRCFQVLLSRHLMVDWARVTLLDAKPQTPDKNLLLSLGARFEQQELRQDNIDSVLAQLVGAGDLVIDLGSGIGTSDILAWCHDNDVLYANTSIEAWKDASDKSANTHPLLDTIFMRYVELYRRCSGWAANAASAVIEHGANPGLVNHWVKFGLQHIGEKFRTADTMSAIAGDDFARLAMLTGTKVIHISERDTQVERSVRNSREFLNTWSPAGLREESLAYSECSWGTHEMQSPQHSLQMGYEGKAHMCIRRHAMQNTIHSWVPEAPIVGMLIPHGETFTIGNRLSVFDERTEQLIYRPTVCFVYRPSPPALESLLDFKHGRMHGFSDRLMAAKIDAGSDELGALLMGKYGSYWFGNRLSIERTRTLVGTQHNATVLQVAASLLGAVLWILQNPRKGLCLPGDLPSDKILSVAANYLGEPEIYRTSWLPSGSLRGQKMSYQFDDFVANDPIVPLRPATRLVSAENTA